MSGVNLNCLLSSFKVSAITEVIIYIYIIYDKLLISYSLTRVNFFKLGQGE